MSPPRAWRLAAALIAILAAAGLAGGALASCERPPAPRSAAAQGEVIPSVSARSFTTDFYGDAQAEGRSAASAPARSGCCCPTP